jgi:hypothetical protein
VGRPPIGKVAMTAAERMRLYRRKLAAAKPVTKPVTKPASDGDDALVKELVQAKTRIAELERELTGEREVNAARAAPRDNKDGRIAELEEEIRGLKLHIRFGPKPRKLKSEKPPLPPDEQRERIIKGLRTRVQNLTRELHYTREWKEAAKARGMSFATRGTIFKPLHSDSRKSLTEGEPLPLKLEAALDEAAKAMNAWLDSLKPPRC